MDSIDKIIYASGANQTVHPFLENREIEAYLAPCKYFRWYVGGVDSSLMILLKPILPEKIYEVNSTLTPVLDCWAEQTLGRDPRLAISFSVVIESVLTEEEHIQWTLKIKKTSGAFLEQWKRKSTMLKISEVTRHYMREDYLKLITSNENTLIEQVLSLGLEPECDSMI